jgi:glycosyltransferase involved in cell wall biosynthesis
MKVAIAHDYLNQYGGAERVLESFLKIFPDAHVYTLLSDRGKVRSRFASSIRGTSFLDVPFIAKHHHPFIPLMPLAVSTMRLKDRYDLLISATAGYAKGIAAPPGTYHLSYCYTPLRYAWESEYIPDALNSRRSIRGRLSSWFVSPAAAYLRRWDFAAAQRPHSMLAISHFIKDKIKTYYGRDADVVYPPVDSNLFYFDSKKKNSASDEVYYLAAGRLLHYKKFDLALHAFRSLGLSLKVVGSGKDGARLRRMTGDKPNIEFLDFVTDEKLRELYAGARGFIFPQVEDFGLVAAEAGSCGTPVIALRKGGALEIVEEGKTGVFFDEQNVSSLIKAIQAARAIKFNRAYIARRAKMFSFAAFKRGILGAIPREIRRRGQA